MKTLAGSFTIDIALRHPSYTPEAISKELSVEPQASWAAGKDFGTFRTQKSHFQTRLAKGDHSSDYEVALSEVVLFLETHESFWTEFIGREGEVEILLNYTVYPPEENGDLFFELYLAPAFLEHLSGRGIGLRIQGWSGKIESK